RLVWAVEFYTLSLHDALPISGFVLLLGSYLLGSIPFGLIVGKLWGSVDVREHGSGNIGTSNVMRTVGKAAATVVLVLDVLKGARSEEHTSELQSRENLVCRLL